MSDNMPTPEPRDAMTEERLKAIEQRSYDDARWSWAWATETIRQLLAEVRRLSPEGAERDSARLDWLEGEMERERAAIRQNCVTPSSLFRRNLPITRAAIDAAMAASAPREEKP